MLAVFVSDEYFFYFNNLLVLSFDIYYVYQIQAKNIHEISSAHHDL